MRVTPEERAEWIGLVAAVSEVVSPTEIVPVCQDPDDDIVIATAVAGRADVICTLDRHVLSPLVQAYCATFPIRILTDAELLAELRAMESSTESASFGVALFSGVSEVTGFSSPRRGAGQ